VDVRGFGLVGAGGGEELVGDDEVEGEGARAVGEEGVGVAVGGCGDRHGEAQEDVVGGRVGGSRGRQVVDVVGLGVARQDDLDFGEGEGEGGAEADVAGDGVVGCVGGDGGGVRGGVGGEDDLDLGPGRDEIEEAHGDD